MAGSHLVLAAIGFVLLAPAAVAFPHLRVIRLGEESKPYVSTSTDSDSPRDVEDTMEEETRIGSSNETASTGPGTACSEHDHCAAILMCLASGTCGCPEHAPVLVRDSGSYACVSQIKAWKPLKITMFPAVLLILAFIVLAFVGYNRLSTDPDDKARIAPGLPCSPRDTSEFRIKNLRNLLKTCHLKERISSRLRIFTLSATQIFKFMPPRQEWSRLEEDVSQSGDSPNAVKQDAVYTAHDIRVKRERSGPFQWNSLGTSHASSHRPWSSVRHVLLQGSTEALRQDKSPRHRTEDSNNDRTRKPTAMPRTRVSTLSTYTLMPCRAGRRTNLSSLVTSSVTKIPVTNAYGYRDAGITDAPHQDRATCSMNLQHLWPRPTTSYRFTESELSGGMLRKHRSELVRQPVTKQHRRAASEGVDLLDVIDKGETMDSRCCYESPTTPSCWYSSEACDCSVWTADPWMTSFEDEDTELKDVWTPANSSQPNWPCEHAQRKLVDQRARTCEAFTVQIGSRPGTAKPAIGNEIAHQDVEIPQFIYSRWPPTQERTRWRRRVPISDGTTSAAPGSPAAAASAASVQDNERPGGQLIGSGEGGGRRPAFMAEVATSRFHRNGLLGFRLPPPPRFDRASLSLDARLATAMLRAERRVKGSSF
ncbi:uncharacterized protein [Dermacentor andersoni]|uniref:uncharacterized protein isoform X1 n=2 Tax=Dermacentor andersoni TaxID=34620 RepID=UPI003B3BBD71